MSKLLRVNKKIAYKLQERLIGWLVLEENEIEIAKKIESQGVNVIIRCQDCSKEEDINKIIEDNKLFNVFVVGHRRSGTGLMVQILEKLGVNMVYHDKVVKGYKTYEVSKDVLATFIKIVTKPYSGCKILIPVDDGKIDILRSTPTKVIFMTRNADDIVRSQERFWEHRKVNPKTITIEQIIAYDTLKDHGIEMLQVNLEDIKAEPEKEIERVRKFVRSDIEFKTTFILK